MFVFACIPWSAPGRRRIRRRAPRDRVVNRLVEVVGQLLARRRRVLDEIRQRGVDEPAVQAADEGEREVDRVRREPRHAEDADAGVPRCSETGWRHMAEGIRPDDPQLAGVDDPEVAADHHLERGRQRRAGRGRPGQSNRVATVMLGAVVVVAHVRCEPRFDRTSAVAALGAFAAAAALAANGVPRPDHVVVVMEENTEASSIYGNTSQRRRRRTSTR